MPISSTYDATAGILHIRITESWPSVQDVSAFRRRIRSAGILSKDTAVLGDLRALSASDEPPWDQLRAAMQVPEMADGPTRYALLVRADLRRMAQMIATVAPAPLEFQVFTEESAALAWLTQRP